MDTVHDLVDTVNKGDGPHPVLVYLHGGGWVLGSPESHHLLAHRFAEMGYLVMNVDYRLAPEHPFPAGFEDCRDAIRWAARTAPTWGGDPARLAVDGDSAGGNLTAATVAALADDPEAPKVSAVLLIYGVFDFAKMEGGLEDFGGEMIEMMVGSYLGAERTDTILADPRVSPIHLAAKLPPAHVVCGTADGLIADARTIKPELDAAGVEVDYHEVADMPHAFVQIEAFPQARKAIERMGAFLKSQGL